MPPPFSYLTPDKHAILRVTKWAYSREKDWKQPFIKGKMDKLTEKWTWP